MKFCISWSMTGKTILEAATLAEAQRRFNGLSDTQLVDTSSNFTQLEVLTESTPGQFDVKAEG
jgi:hypothetical protein